MYIIIYEEDERWVDLVYKNIKPMYEISTYGHIRNKKTKSIMSECVDPEKGYLMVGLMVETSNNMSKQKTFKIHRLVAHTFLECPIVCIGDFMTVNHKHVDSDGVKRDNSIYNLEWVTFSENIKHSYSEGLNTPRRGVLSGSSKYSEDVIRYICTLIQKNYKAPYIIKQVKDKFSIDINKSLVSKLKRKHAWIHISDEYF